MKVNLNKQFKSLDGKEFPTDDSNMGKVLASALSSSNKGNSIKLFDWSMKWFNKQEVEMDDTDFDVLKGLVESAENMNVLCKAQLLAEFEKIKKPKK
jgi:hypothetical protein